MAKYVWPGNGEPMARSSVLYFYNMGLRYRQLKEPVCWACGDMTKELPPGSLLLYAGRCGSCQEKRREAAMEQIEKESAAATKQHEDWLRKEMMNTLRDTTANASSRVFAREVLADLIPTPPTRKMT